MARRRGYTTFPTPASLCRIRAAVGAGRTAFRESWRAVDSLLRMRRLETLSALQPLAEIQVHMFVNSTPPEWSSTCSWLYIHCRLHAAPEDCILCCGADCHL